MYCTGCIVGCGSMAAGELISIALVWSKTKPLRVLPGKVGGCVH